MGRAPSHKKVRYGPKTSYGKTVCEKQFPECPETPSSDVCGNCPLWGSGVSKAYREKETEKEEQMTS